MQAQITLLNKPNPAPLTLEKSTPVHFIGVGGIGMSALAKVLLEQGFNVSGSDAKENAYTAMLMNLGGKIFIGHEPANVPDGAIVVASSAITTENPEAREAFDKGLNIYHRSDLLREIFKRFETPIGLTGTHGKTSMTGMTGLILQDGGLDPTILAGGKMPHLGTNAKVGGELKYAVAELDESDGTVIQYQPKISVIANLELDHPDHYQDGLQALINTFRHFLDGLDRESEVLFNMDCPVTRELYAEYRHRVKAMRIYPDSQPLEPEMDSYWLDGVTVHLEGGYQAELYQGHEHLGRIWLQVPGRHNLANAMFSGIIGLRLGILFESVARTLENFTGMGRRFEQLGKYNGARIVDDYAHHPTEVIATLKAAREFNRHKGRVIAMFQPHRYHRLETLWQEFLEAFEDADEVIIVDVYSAGESLIEGIDSQHFAHAMEHPAVEYWPSSDWALVQARLKKILTPDDLFITLGAGDITQLGRKLVAGE